MERAEYERMNAVEDHMWWYRSMHTNMLDALRRYPGPPQSVLLDAGCGTGGLLRRISEAVPDRQRFGMDIDEAAVAIARAKSHTSIAVASVNQLPFPDASLGVIFSLDVLCHRQIQPVDAVAEAFRCLKPDGVLIVNLPAYQWLYSFHDKRVHNARRYTRTQVCELLARAGFSKIYATYWNSLLFPIMVVHRKLSLTKAKASDAVEYPKFVERLFGAIMVIERGMMRVGFRYPFGGSVLAIAVK